MSMSMSAPRISSDPDPDPPPPTLDGDESSIGSHGSAVSVVPYLYDKAPGFEDGDFMLPAELPIDIRAINKYRDGIKAAKDLFNKRLQMCQSASTLKKVDEFTEVPTLTIPHPNPLKRGVVERAISLRIRRSGLEAINELNTIKSVISYQQLFPDDEDNMNFEPSTRDNPLIGSCEEKLEDLFQEETEAWCKAKGLKYISRYTNKEQRLLRKWFRDMDEDGSGEVSVAELLDPMLSSGILKTKEQCMRALSNVDRNLTAGIDFDEFMQALSSDNLADGNKLKVLQQMSMHPIYSMDTLLNIERRRKIMTSIIDEMNYRQERIERKLLKMNDPKNSKYKFLREQREYENLEDNLKKSKELHDVYMKNLNIVVKEKLIQMDLEGKTLANLKPLGDSDSLLGHGKAEKQLKRVELSDRKVENIKYEDIDKSMFPSVGSFGKRAVDDLLNKNPAICYSPLDTRCQLFNSNLLSKEERARMHAIPAYDPNITKNQSFVNKFPSLLRETSKESVKHKTKAHSKHK